MRGRRQQIVLRVRVRREKKLRFVFFLILCIGSAALFLFRNQLCSQVCLLPFRFQSKIFPARNVDFLGFSPGMRQSLDGQLPKAGGSVLFFGGRRFGRTVEERFPWVREVRVKKSYFPPGLRVEAIWRVPVARLARQGRTFLLDSGGTAYPPPTPEITAGPPAGEAGLPLAELEALEPQGLTAVAQFLGQVQYDHALDFLSSPVTHIRTEPPGVGLVFFLENGTKISWGDWEPSQWQVKLERLKMVVEDATKRYGRISYINLRHFEEGKIVVRPQTG